MTLRQFYKKFLRANMASNMASNNCVQSLAKGDNRNVANYWNYKSGSHSWYM